MPFSFNLSSGNYLSTQDVEVLQRATRDHQMERLTIGERSFSVRYQSAMDAFIVDPVQGELYSGLSHTELADIIRLNRPGFPGECFICELRLPDHRFRWKHNKLFLLLPEEYGPAFP
ncbi:hypothetical protein MMS23_25645, partial [Escherichia coli]|nr:hypothetical protein [Escherichia coli]MCM5023092.1 hypothetical protein [Escherichia coli]